MCLDVAPWIADDQRGWCFFEECAASWVKGPHRLLNLGLLRIPPAEIHQDCYFESVENVCKSERKQPLLPLRFEEFLCAKHFTQGSDHRQVCNSYQKLFDRVSHAVTMLDFRGQNWTDVRHLAECLVAERAGQWAFDQLRQVRLNRNPIADLQPLRDVKAKRPKLQIFVDLNFGRDVQEIENIPADQLSA